MKTLSKAISMCIAVAATLLLIVFLAQCSGETQSEGDKGYINVSPLALKSMMETRNFQLINVHVPYAGEIPGTDMFISYTEIGQKLDLPKDSKIVLYCRSGPMSKIAAETLVKQGYTKIYNLEKGMVDWQQSGYEIVHKPQD